MSATVTRLPTSSPSYITVRKAGQAWDVQIVTPAPRSALRTTIARCSDREDAVEYGQQQAAAIQRPFRMKAHGG